MREHDALSTSRCSIGQPGAGATWRAATATAAKAGMRHDPPASVCLTTRGRRTCMHLPAIIWPCGREAGQAPQNFFVQLCPPVLSGPVVTG